MRRTVRHTSSQTAASRTIADRRLSDGAVRLFCWLMSHDDGEDVDVEEYTKMHGRAGRTHVRELEEAGLVKMEEDKVQTYDPNAERERKAAAFNIGRDRYQKHVEARRSRVAEARRDRTDETNETQQKPKPFTAATFRKVWAAKWADRWPDIRMPMWGRKELGIAKQLIARLGEEDAKKLLEVLFEEWEATARRYRLKGYPSIEWCMAFRNTAVLELVSGKQVGGSPQKRKGEYDEGSSREEDDVGWGGP